MNRGGLSLVCALLAGAVLSPDPLHGQGFEIRSEGAVIRIGGRLHAQFAHSTAAESRSAAFLVRRARLGVDVTLSDRLDGKMEHDFLDGLQDAFLRWKVAPGFAFSVGQFKRAFDLFELDSTHQISVVERAGDIPGLSTCAGVGGICSLSRFSESLEYSRRDIGVRAQGELGRFSYMATLTNGAGMNAGEQNGAKSWAGRAAVALSEQLRVGGGVSVHDYLLAGEDEYATAFSGDLEYGDFLRPGPHLQVGFIGGDNWKAGEGVSFLTGQAIFTHFIPLDSGARKGLGLEPVARFSLGDPDRGGNRDAGTLLSPGLVIHLEEGVRIGTSLDIWNPEAGRTEFSLKIQSYFRF